MRFTNAYASSSTCTPRARICILTWYISMEKWKWRKVLPGTAPLVIDTAKWQFLNARQQGGIQLVVVENGSLGLELRCRLNQKSVRFQIRLLFDYSLYLWPLHRDRVPTVYIERWICGRLDPNDPIEWNYDQEFEVNQQHATILKCYDEMHPWSATIAI